MQKNLRPFPLWLSVLMMVLAGVLAVMLAIVLRRDVVSTDTAADRAFRSALLPDDWLTFGGNVWSIGYPDDWQAVPGTFANGMQTANFSSDDGDYLFIAEREETASELEAQYEQKGIKEKSEFYFAGYPAAKYVFQDGSEAHLISYDDRLFMIATASPDNGQVNIMLATFQFLR